MVLHEPMTVLTDYALAAAAGYCAWRVRSMARGVAASPWMWALVSLAIAAFSGGTTHGFPVMPETVFRALWKLTQVAIGFAALQVVRATASRYFVGSVARWVNRVAVAQFVLYCAWIAFNEEFIYSILDYGIAFVFALAVHGSAALGRRDRPARWISTGIVVSFAGAAIQAVGIAPHPQFNHNDLYHVVQIVGAWLIYRGVVNGGSSRVHKDHSRN